MRTLIIKFEFDGTDFVGWQMQPGQRSLQGEITTAFNRMTKSDLKIIVAGRTDTGVHGNAQIATISIDKFGIPENKIVKAINTVLPNDIQLLDAQIIDGEYSARYDAIARQYNYYVTDDYSVFKRRYFGHHRASLNVEMMNEASKAILGKHNFTTFSKVNNDLKHYECDVQLCEWIRINENDVKFIIKSNRFVYSMVRSLVGTLLEIGSSRLPVNYMADSLKALDRSLCSRIAPANGLFFDKAFFNTDYRILR